MHLFHGLYIWSGIMDVCIMLEVKKRIMLHLPQSVEIFMHADKPTLYLKMDFTVECFIQSGACHKTLFHKISSHITTKS